VRLSAPAPVSLCASEAVSLCRDIAVLPIALPIEPRVTGEVAAAVLDRLARSIAFVSPRRSTYPSAVTRCNARGLRSGAVYDALTW
jgi:hypothetical protein